MKSRFSPAELEYIRKADAEQLLKYLHPNGRSISEPCGTFFPVGVQHDYWSAYRYGDEIKIVYFKVGIPHWTEKAKEKAKQNKKSLSQNSDSEQRFASSLSRTKSTVFEIASCNEFQHFCTFTLDKSKRDRYDLPAFVKALTMFIRNRNRDRSEKVKYLLLPEHHKDGAWHLHGLFQNLSEQDLTPFKLSDKIPQKLKNQIKNGETVYNFKDYMAKYGFFTATDIMDKMATSKYITKYITKDLQGETLKAGAHLFYASQGLKRRETLVKNSFDRFTFDDWDYENDYIKVKTFRIS